VAFCMGFDSPYEVDAAGKRSEFQEQLLERKITAEICSDFFITDRSVADVLTYYALHESRKMSSGTIQKARDAFGRYTHIFLLPMIAHFEPGTDPCRLGATYRGYHETFEQLCFSWIFDFASNHRFSAQVIELNAAPLAERVNDVIAIVTEGD
jgi:hypothetical protein